MIRRINPRFNGIHIRSTLALVSFIAFFCACESAVTYSTQDVVVDINPCIEMLSFERQDGCATYYRASNEGCFVLSDQQGSTQAFPILINEEGLSALNGEDDLIGALSLSTEGEAKMSIFLFSSDHSSAPNRCQALSVESACEGDCVISVHEHPLEVSQQASLLKISATACEWTPADQELLEILCDQLDNDCDGLVDENENDPEAAVEGVACVAGQGLCQSEGTFECLDGVGQAPRCSAVARDVSEDELCDGLDNDCDGEEDEGYGVNEACVEYEGTSCVTEGVVQCEQVSEDDPIASSGGVFCDLGDVDPLTKVVEREAGGECDGADNDCDFAVDEHFTPQVVDCGVGSCSEQAVTTCAEGVLDDACRIGEPEGDDDNCDNVDDDCDGKVDEAFEISFITCGLGVCSSNGPILCDRGMLNNLCNERSPQGNDSDCDGIDDDCDGRFDEHYQTEQVQCGVGACQRTGTKSCIDSQITTYCTPSAPSLDLCDGFDNDCDGTVDERFASEVTTCGLGFCQRTGSTYCSSGDILDSCTPLEILNPNDLCDGIDSDCDGRVDEDHLTLVTSCGVGACTQTGQLLCVNGSLFDNCSASLPSNSDVDFTCDGVDSDCDGRADEGFEGELVTCGQGSCAATGYTTCFGGESNGTTCVIGQPSNDDASCDGINQDCDERIDEDYEPQNTNCGIGACRRSGTSSCENGTENIGCVPGQPVGNDASCDGIDADCDNRIDEGYQSSVTTCGLGVCQRNGQRRCQNGMVINTCVVGPQMGLDNQCDQLDNDCDGVVDEGYVSTSTQCGVGICESEGYLVCTPLGLVDTCSEQAPIDTDWRCDNIDTDCDGLVDESYISRQVTCGVGACLANGQTACRMGEVVNLCEAGVPAATEHDNNCDLVDNDCDGSIDESYSASDHSVSCQNNACTGSGNIICTNTGPINTCVVSDGSIVDNSCDGINQDCDDFIDEHYVAPSDGTIHSCGVGACLNTNGVLDCVDGSVITICTPNSPIGLIDNTCDGVDDDCDGLVDESFAESSDCGVGSCQRTVAYSCVNGQRINNCVPGMPAAFDVCGNGTDDDCNGIIDTYGLGGACVESFQACVNTGVYQCNAELDGVVCSATVPQASAESCDGVDNDCDQSVDEDVLYAQPQCESDDPNVFGTCRQGSFICQGGNDFCQPSGVGTEASCSGDDEDCDGFVDEERPEGNPIRRLGASCGSGSCRWRCSGGDTSLRCRRDNGNICN